MAITRGTVQKGSAQTFYPRIDPSIPHEVQRHLQLIYSKLNNHMQAFSQIASAQVGGAAKGETLQQIVGKTRQLTINQTLGLPGAGAVNDQTGGLTRTAYTTQQVDSGALVIVGDQISPVTVTLDSGVSTPWATFISNHGTTVANLVPQSGMIIYSGDTRAASMPLSPGSWCMVGFDGVDFWAAVMPDFTAPPPTGTLRLTYSAVTTAYTIDPATDHQIECTSGTFAVTLPSAAGIAGQAFAIKNSGTGTITVTAQPGEAIDGSPTQPLTQYDNVTVMSNNANWIIV